MTLSEATRRAEEAEWRYLHARAEAIALRNAWILAGEESERALKRAGEAKRSLAAARAWMTITLRQEAVAADLAAGGGI